MKSQEKTEIALGIGNTSFNPKDAITWVENQDTPSQLVLVFSFVWPCMPRCSQLVNNDNRQTDVIFQELLENASKPKHLSGNTCAKLCGFLEQCSKSSSHVLRTFAFSEDTALRLFDFYVEWNEQDSPRSMRLVLDFLAYSISNNPITENGVAIKSRILQDTVTMITRQSSKPSVKSAMSYIEYVVQRNIVYLSDVLESYREVHNLALDSEIPWDDFVSQLFNWMELQYVCSVAGKLIVTVFTSPWRQAESNRFHSDSWHRFIYEALQANLELLEPIKLYVFIPLFRVDKAESLRYINHLSSLQRLTTRESTEWDLNSMLWLAMLEAGKKAGVVDEPGTGRHLIIPLT